MNTKLHINYMNTKQHINYMNTKHTHKLHEY